MVKLCIPIVTSLSRTGFNFRDILLKEKPHPKPPSGFKVRIGCNRQSRRQLQKNIHAREFVIQAEVATKTDHHIVVVVPPVTVVVAYPNERARAVKEIERFVCAESLKPQPVHIDEEKIAVVVVEIPGKQDVGAHGAAAVTKVQVQSGRVANLETDTDVLGGNHIDNQCNKDWNEANRIIFKVHSVEY